MAWIDGFAFSSGSLQALCRCRSPSPVRRLASYRFGVQPDERLDDLLPPIVSLFEAVGNDRKAVRTNCRALIGCGRSVPPYGN